MFGYCRHYCQSLGATPSGNNPRPISLRSRQRPHRVINPSYEPSQVSRDRGIDLSRQMFSLPRHFPFPAVVSHALRRTCNFFFFPFYFIHAFQSIPLYFSHTHTYVILIIFEQETKTFEQTFSTYKIY